MNTIPVVGILNLLEGTTYRINSTERRPRTSAAHKS